MLWIDVGAPRREVYFLGLIDVLTQYDTKKKAAHAAKAVKHGVREQQPQSVCQIFIIGRGFRIIVGFCVLQAGSEISTVHPDQYAKRFLEFISKIFA